MTHRHSCLAETSLAMFRNSYIASRRLADCCQEFTARGGAGFAGVLDSIASGANLAGEHRWITMPAIAFS